MKSQKFNIFSSFICFSYNYKGKIIGCVHHGKQIIVFYQNKRGILYTWLLDNPLSMSFVTK